MAIRVLVTGASGFVGRYLVLTLLKQGYSVTACARRFSAIPGLAHPKLEPLLVDDINDVENWGAKELAGVDVIIHTAARVHMPAERSDEQLEFYRETNTRATQLLAERAALFGVQRFVFLSSIKVNGEKTNGRALMVSDSTDPQCPYGISKAEAEEELKKVSEKTALNIVIIRPPLVYGPGVKANFNALFEWVRKGYPLPFGSINNRRSLVSVFNLVDLLITCISHPNASNQTFLVSDGESVSTRCLVLRMSQSLGKDIWLPAVPLWVLKTIGGLAGKSAAIQRLCDDLEVDISNTADLLEWHPKYDMDETLSYIVADKESCI